MNSSFLGRSLSRQQTRVRYLEEIAAYQIECGLFEFPFLTFGIVQVYPRSLMETNICEKLSDLHFCMGSRRNELDYLRQVASEVSFFGLIKAVVS